MIMKISKRLLLITALVFVTMSGYSQNGAIRSNSYGMESIAPNIFVDDIQETISFYEKLGFQTQMKNPDTEDPEFVLMTCGKVTVMFQTFKSLGNELPIIKREKGSSLLLYIQIQNIEGFYQSIKDKVEVYREPEKTFYGATEFSIVDYNNYILTFAEHLDN